MVILRICRLSLALAPLLLLVVAGGCETEPVAPNGTCVVKSDVTPVCNGAVDGGPTANFGLVGYSCTGKARPDDDAKYVEGVPSGRVCANLGAPGAGGAQDYCCTAETTACAYNPVATCDDQSYGYQCLGSDRPEALNSKISCGQGVDQGDFVNYCCSGTPKPPACTASAGDKCAEWFLGWTCLGDELPKVELLDRTSSKADYYHFICSTPRPTINHKYNNYCCYAPALVPEGGSCVGDTHVPGCAPGRFGFACYGPETPEEDYLPMHCPEPGVAGKSAEGYPAKLYCCDFR